MNPSERGLSRRDFIVGGGTIVLAVVLARLLGRKLGWESAKTDLESERIQGELIKTEKLVEDEELVKLYIEKIQNNMPAEPDPTIVKSTAYNAMGYFGLDEAIRRRRIERISYDSPADQLCRGGICTYWANGDIAMVIKQLALEVNNNNALNWVAFLNFIAHDSYHLAVDSQDNREQVEEYGVLGKIKVGWGKRGFFANLEDYRGIIGEITNVKIKGNDGKSVLRINLLEEFFAEWARYRYVNHLKQFGLDKLNMQVRPELISGYPIFTQGVVDIDSKTLGSWQDYWGGSLNPVRVDNLHRQNKRRELLQGIGDRITALNRNSSSELLSEGNTAALGLIAFADFSDYKLSGHGILRGLLTSALNPDIIYDFGKMIADKKDRFVI